MSAKVNPRNELKPKGLKGISDQQLEYHFETHYKGYISKINEVWDKMQTVDRSKANQNFSDYRALKVEESFNYMGVVLHAQHAHPEREPPGVCSGARSLPCRTNAWLDGPPVR
jgi:superoxide dismutase